MESKEYQNNTQINLSTIHEPFVIFNHNNAVNSEQFELRHDIPAIPSPIITLLLMTMMMSLTIIHHDDASQIRSFVQNI